MVNKSDKEVWTALKQGNHSALEHIYSTHFPFLFNYGKKIAYNSEMVEDAIQELFVEIWSKKDQLSHTDNIRPYLTISIKRKLIKKISKTRETTNEFVDNMFGSEDAMENLIINQEANSEKATRIKEALDKLSGRQKEIIYLKYYQGMDYEDIAEIMDISYQSSRNLVSKALKQLGSIMAFIIFTIFIVKNI